MNLLTLTILLFFIGFALIIIEFFLIPGFGFTGILGFLFLCGGCYITWTYIGAMYGVIMTAISIAVVIISIIYFPKTKFAKKLVLNKKEARSEGFSSQKEDEKSLLGKEGALLTSARPAGVAEIEGKRIDVVTDSEFLDKGDKIKVIKIDGNRIVIEKK